MTDDKRHPCTCTIDTRTGRIMDREAGCEAEHPKMPVSEVPVQRTTIKNMLKRGRVIE